VDGSRMTDLLLTFLGALTILAVGAAALYFVLRSVFVRAADHAAAHIESALNRMARNPTVSNVGRVAATPWTRYVRADEISDLGARQDFADRIERLARLMDTAIRLPVIGRVGLDALLGLFPVVGDVSSAAIGLSLVARSLKYGLPRELIARMLANVLVDVLLGAVPVVGDLADIWYKANMRNVALLREYLERTRGNGQ
jgi:hypothetical protein